MIRCPNTSPLLILARLDRLDLLGEYDSVVLTQAVLTEVREKHDVVAERVDRLAGDCRSAVEPEIVSTIDPSHDLGPGERSVLAWAVSQFPSEALCVLDDAAARREAARLGLRMTGTLGLILRAKQDGRVRAAAPLVHDAVAAGLYLDDATLAAALHRVGESWKH
ncbi:MAG: DUF3368 domain-containing protein [Myxococcota bacterium]